MSLENVLLDLLVLVVGLAIGWAITTPARARRL